ncbi:MAG: LamG domain-containing protein [Planctomycetes bacterium]|nr:LamG domain-containing protein [Planctomycetota bacterium]
MKHLTPALLGATLASSLPAQNGITLTNGVDGFLEIPYAAAVVPQSGITLEAWLTYDDTTLPTGWRFPTVARQNIAPGQEAYFLRINAGNTGARTLTWKVVTPTGAFNCNWPFASGQLNTWTHVAATWDGAAARLFVNGAEVATANGNGQPLYDRGGVLRIGKGDDSGGPIEVWNGQLDEVRLWPFARTAAEITQAMPFHLASVPGLVSTWNLDGSGADSSGGLNATVNFTVPFTTNTLTLTQLAAPSALAVGTSTAGCSPLRMTFSSLPQAGNAAFAAVCTRSSANSVAFLALAFGTAPAPLPIFGIDFLLDLGSTVLFVTNSSPLGVARQTIGFPSFIPQGQTFAFQCGFVDACGSQGFAASDAMITITQ